MRLTTVNWEALAKQLTGVYKKFNVPIEGIYDWESGCREPCCNPLAHKMKKFSNAVNAVFAAFGLDETTAKNFSYVADDFTDPCDIDSVIRIVERLRSMACDHVWVLKGKSSMTSAGPRDVYECIDCKSTELRKGDAVATALRR